MREVDPVRERKSVSAENTFRHRYRLVPAAGEAALGRRGRGLRPAQGKALSRLNRDAEAENRGLPHPHPIALAGKSDPARRKIFDAGREMLASEIDGTRYRLIGIGVSALADAEEPTRPTCSTSPARRAAAERAIDRVRGKFGHEAVMKGLGA